MKRIVIIGATSAIASAVAREFSKKAPAEFALVGRNAGLLSILNQDLLVRNPDNVVVNYPSELESATSIHDVVKRILNGGKVDIVLIAQGSLPDQKTCEGDPLYLEQSLIINAYSPVGFAEAFVIPMLASGGGTIAVIGSVAGDRGRKSNYAYGAAKSLVATYLNGLQHRLAGSSVNMLLIKPGPVNTPMTAHLQEGQPGMASVDQVAADVVNAIAKGKSILYTPFKWKVIMTVVRLMPAPIFNRLDF